MTKKYDLKLQITKPAKHSLDSWSGGYFNLIQIVFQSVKPLI